jgi:hypothetical protein
MSVTLTQTRIRPDDNGYTVVMIGINYQANKVLVRVRFDSGDTQDIEYEGARLLALRNALPQFSGLRLAIEQYLAANEPGLGGNAA